MAENNPGTTVATSADGMTIAPVVRVRRRSLAASLLSAAAVVVAMMTPAEAAWSARGTGGGAAAADRLAAPANVTSSCGLLDLGGSSLKVSWGWPSSARFAPDRFEIERSTDGGLSWSPAGTVVGTALQGLASVLFEDKGLTVLGTYHYRVTAVKGNWRTSVQAPPRTLVLGLLGLANICT